MERVSLYSIYEKEFAYTAGTAVLPACCSVSRCGETEEGSYMVSAFQKKEGVYAVRIMPEQMGEYRYRIWLKGSEESEEIKLEGAFVCVEPREGRHGKVQTKEDGFVYTDGTRFLPFGTTCYAWTHQPEELQEQTVNTLRKSCFNKLRMLLFPKFMPYNEDDPAVYPFGQGEEGEWDVNRIVPAYWDNLDLRLRQLEELGIEADLILFHPYDKWGFAEMTQEASLLYVSYCVARLAAYHNVWWSLANEYEMLMKKNVENWDDYGCLLQKEDPYHHLISIHQILQLYPKKGWMTHCSVQSGNIDFIPAWKKEYQLPVLIDVCGYEGDLEYGWGNLSAFDMVDRFWWTVTRGGYCTHGETFHREDAVLWWGKGGVMHGESEPRIRFLKELLYELPGCGRAAVHGVYTNPNGKKGEEMTEADRHFNRLIESTPVENLTGLMAEVHKVISTDSWQLRYYGRTCPCFTWLKLPENGRYRIEVIDVWEMTRKTVLHGAVGRTRISLPAHPGMAVLAMKDRFW